jgi:hypothetical protein
LEIRWNFVFSRVELQPLDVALGVVDRLVVLAVAVRLLEAHQPDAGLVVLQSRILGIDPAVGSDVRFEVLNLAGEQAQLDVSGARTDELIGPITFADERYFYMKVPSLDQSRPQYGAAERKIRAVQHAGYSPQALRRFCNDPAAGESDMDYVQQCNCRTD